jgi:hypothetical protein
MILIACGPHAVPSPDAGSGSDRLTSPTRAILHRVSLERDVAERVLAYSGTPVRRGARAPVARCEMSEQIPEYDAYLDDPFDDTTGFGYGEDPGADTPAADDPDPEPDDQEG